MNPILMLLIQMLTQAQQAPQEQIPPNPLLGGMEPQVGFPQMNIPRNDPMAGPPDFQALARGYLGGRNV